MPNKKVCKGDCLNSLSKIAQAGINIKPIVEERSYFIGNGANERKNFVNPLKIRDECINDYINYRKGKYLSESRLLEEIINEDLQLLLNSKEKDTKRELMETVLRNYKPEAYIEATKDSLYEISISKCPNKIKRAARASDSCISGEKLSYYKKVVVEPGTIFLVAKQNKVLKGYSRLFLMKDDKKQSFLAIDILRLSDYKSGNCTGLVHAVTLASIQLGFDIHADYIIEKNSQDGDALYIDYEPKEAFNNITMNVELTKLGDKPETNYAFNWIYQGTVNILMQNWKKFS